MPQLSHEEYQGGRWSNKPRGRWENAYEKPRDEENCPPNLDYNFIEQIADGVEKMILAWRNGEERKTYASRSPVSNSATSSPKNVSGGKLLSSFQRIYCLRNKSVYWLKGVIVCTYLN